MVGGIVPLEYAAMASDLFDVVEQEKGGAAIVLRIVTEPGPGKPTVAARQHDALRIRLPMPPASDRANSSIIELVADIFSVDVKNVSIEEGIKQRNKRLKVTNVTADDARAAIDRSIGTTLSAQGAKRSAT